MTFLDQYPIVLAVWLGVLTSISPCPLGTNVAALAYLSRQSKYNFWLRSLAYILGRALVYLVLMMLAFWAEEALFRASRFVQETAPAWIGPGLIVVGLLMTGWIPLPSISLFSQERIERLGTKVGFFFPFVLGAIFALAFCPVSAGIFFGAVVGLALQQGGLTLAFSYALGTALPVLILAVIFRFSVAKAGQMVGNSRHWQRWLAPITGLVFAGAGVHLVLKHYFGV